MKLHLELRSSISNIETSTISRRSSIIDNKRRPRTTRQHHQRFNFNYSHHPTMNKFVIALLAIPHAHSFTPSTTALRTSSQHHNAVLEGREIEGVLAPTNNFILVKKAAVEEQTTGGILLTGSVRDSFRCYV